MKCILCGQLVRDSHNNSTCTNCKRIIRVLSNKNRKRLNRLNKQKDKVYA